MANQPSAQAKSTTTPIHMAINLTRPNGAKAKQSPRGGGRYVIGAQATVTIAGLVAINVPVWIGATPNKSGGLDITPNVGKPDKSISIIDADFSAKMIEAIETAVDNWNEWPAAYDHAIEMLVRKDGDTAPGKPAAFKPRSVLVDPKTGQRVPEPAARA